MKRVRLLIYTGPESWIDSTRERYWVKPGKNEISEGKSIESIELPEDVLDWLLLKLTEVGAI
jgi:hypothetical protein